MGRHLKDGGYDSESRAENLKNNICGLQDAEKYKKDHQYTPNYKLCKLILTEKDIDGKFILLDQWGKICGRSREEVRKYVCQLKKNEGTNKICDTIPLSVLKRVSEYFHISLYYFTNNAVEASDDPRSIKQPASYRYVPLVANVWEEEKRSPGNNMLSDWRLAEQSRKPTKEEKELIKEAREEIKRIEHNTGMIPKVVQHFTPEQREGLEKVIRDYMETVYDEWAYQDFLEQHKDEE